jgi:iron complex transport system substrate-binding protein
MDVESLAHEAVDCGFKVHQRLGPGLLESVYEMVLASSLSKRGLQVKRQKSVSFVVDDMTFDDAFRSDLLVEGSLIIEVKSVEGMHPVHGKQVLTYLRLMKLPLGFLMNFGMARFKDGVHRIANNYYRPRGE